MDIYGKSKYKLYKKVYHKKLKIFNFSVLLPKGIH